IARVPAPRDSVATNRKTGLRWLVTQSEPGNAKGGRLLMPPIRRSGIDLWLQAFAVFSMSGSFQVTFFLPPFLRPIFPESRGPCAAAYLWMACILPPSLLVLYRPPLTPISPTP